MTIAERIFNLFRTASAIRNASLSRCRSSLQDNDGVITFTFRDGSRIKYTADVDVAQVL